MKCEDIRERMPDVAAGYSTPTTEERDHLASCNTCAAQLKEMSSTMALLDEWQTPEPSPYFDVRLQARLREEMANPQAVGCSGFGVRCWQVRSPSFWELELVYSSPGVGLTGQNRRLLKWRDRARH